MAKRVLLSGLKLIHSAKASKSEVDLGGLIPEQTLVPVASSPHAALFNRKTMDTSQPVHARLCMKYTRSQHVKIAEKAKALIVFQFML